MKRFSKHQVIAQCGFVRIDSGDYAMVNGPTVDAKLMEKLAAGHSAKAFLTILRALVIGYRHGRIEGLRG